MNSDPDAHQLTASLRILDANLNRAVEGLRVVEEFVRFQLDDAHLTRLYKELRHDLVTGSQVIDQGRRLAARETQQDVGTGLSTAAERHRASARDVARASQKRVEQALRCLEEYGKTLDPDWAAQLEQLRYRVYTLGRALELTQHSRERLSGACLYVLIDGGSTEEAFTRLVDQLVAAGADVIQLRDTELDDRQLLARARILRTRTLGSRTQFIMNNRADLAVLAHADGVHVGQEDVSVKDARTIVGPDSLIGVSTHSLDQARQAVLDGANYLGCGPVFPSRTKTFAAFPGLAYLGQVAAEVTLPCFAIGGITLENLSDVFAAGFHRVAVSSAITQADDAGEACAQLLKKLKRRPAPQGQSQPPSV